MAVSTNILRQNNTWNVGSVCEWSLTLYQTIMTLIGIFCRVKETRFLQVMFARPPVCGIVSGPGPLEIFLKFGVASFH
jgi:hypothetical protein